MGSWDEVKRTLTSGRSEQPQVRPGLFVRLPDDGSSVIGAFVGEPFFFKAVWNGSRHEAYNPAVHTEKPRVRYMINFFSMEEDEMKVFEFGARLMESVVKVHEKYGLEKWLFEVKRYGRKGDQKTTYTVLPEVQMDERMARKVASHRLHDLERLAPRLEDEAIIPSPSSASSSSSSSSPFSESSSTVPQPKDTAPLAGFL